MKTISENMMPLDELDKHYVPIEKVEEILKKLQDIDDKNKVKGKDLQSEVD